MTGKALDGVLHLHRQQPHALTQVPLIGAVLDGKYRILRQIGAGGMGMVFEAENLALKRLVAIKVVLKSGSAEALTRLEREARLVAAIQHPNICDVYDVGRLPSGGPYVVLERLFGDTLAAQMKVDRAPRLSNVVDLFVQALSGLHAAHAAYILHRDLKPQNIFLHTRLGCPPIVKVVDFGLAQDLTGMSGERITLPGKSCGTAQYMSPEQIRADRLDPRSDLFAVGVMLYEILAGRHPFAGGSRLDMQMRILRAEPKPLRRRRPDVSLEVERIVMSAMAKDPALRPRSAYEMQQALSAAIRRRAPSSPDFEEEAGSSMTTQLWIPPSSTPAHYD